MDNFDKIVQSISFDFPYSKEEYMNNMVMENQHNHTSFSNTIIADSSVSPEDYAKKSIEYGAKCLFSGEHGTQGNQFEVYETAEKYGLRYVHSTEAYWVKDRHEKDKTNCHICLYALNNEAREDINYILSLANEDGYYFRPRIDLELLHTLNPKNIIVTSACVAGWLYDDADDTWIELAHYFGDNFFFELQPHNTDKQRMLNKRIIKLASDNNIDIICGLDSHVIDDVSYEKRSQILKYKKIEYPDEDGWYLDYPDGKEVFNRFKEQGILTDEQILRAIMNTNVFSVKCEDIVFDRAFKIPNIFPDKSYDERVKLLKGLLNEKYKLEKLKSPKKADGIKWEVNQIVDSGVVDYFILNHYGLKKAVEECGGVLTTTSRGSMASFVVNKLLGFTTIDRFNSEIPIYPERFLTKERVLSGQMPDCDFNVSSQEPFVRAFREILGEHSVYPLMAIEKLKEKASWQLYAGANDVPPDKANEISKYIEQYMETLKYIEDEEDKKAVDIEEYIPSEYIELYRKSQEYQKIVVNLKVHACGYLMLEGDIRRKIGLISAISETTGKRTLCACVEGGYLDSFGMVKNDFLIVDCVGLIKECFDSIGQEVPTFDELRELIKGDEPTWDIYKNGITMCVNQVEKSSTSKKAQKYQMKSLAESSAFIAGIRPGFRSLIGGFLDRKPYTTGEKKIDDVLKDSFHYLIYQESIMKVLAYLGLSMGETYSVIKSISKKKLKGEKLHHLYEQLQAGWLEKIGNTDNFSKVWQVINDASRYSFNAPHSLSMGGDSAYIAWFKAHHTEEFYEVAINHYQIKDKKDKIDALVKEIMKFYGYGLGDYRFGNDNRNVNIDRETKKIYPSLSSIKNMPKIVPDILYENKDVTISNNFELYDFLYSHKEINKTGLEILFKLDYFSNILEMNKGIEEYEIYKKYIESKVLSKDKLSEIEMRAIKSIEHRETEKQIRGFSSIDFIKSIISFSSIKPTSKIQKMKYQIQLLGYTDIVHPKCPNDIFMVLSSEINKYGTPFVKLYQIQSGDVFEIKADKKYWNKGNQLEKMDVIRAVLDTKAKMKKVDDKFVKTGEFERVLKLWGKIK